MSNTLRPITLVPLEAPAAPMPEVVPAAEAAASGSLFGKLADYAGDLVTRAVITAQIKTEAAVGAVAGYVKEKGTQAAVRVALSGLALGGMAAVATGALMPKETEAATGPQYTVAANAAGGVFSRNTPRTADTPRITGQGAYPGDVLTLECGVTDGDPVGPYSNHTWHYVHDNNRNEPDFWINDHYMNTPNAANQLAPSEARCANESSNPLAQQSAVNMQPVAQHEQAPAPQDKAFVQYDWMTATTRLYLTPKEQRIIVNGGTAAFVGVVCASLSDGLAIRECAGIAGFATVLVSELYDPQHVLELDFQGMVYEGARYH